MTQTFNYISPQDPWTTTLDNVRRGSVSLTELAENLQVGNGNFSIDDDAGTAGHSSDGIVGLKTLTVEQSACSVARIFSGFIAARTYGRGDEQIFTSSTGRQIDVQVVDLNAKAGFLRITGSDGKRPAETVDARLSWLLGSAYVGTLFAASSYNDSSSITMDATDYRGQTPGDVITDCQIAAKGFNAFIFYNDATDADELWFANSNASTAWTSTIKVSNVAADVDSTTTFAPAEDWKLTRNPERIVAGVYFPYAKGATYQTRAATADTYEWRDGVAPTSTIKSLTRATAAARQFLWESHTEEDRLTVKLRMRAAYVNLVRAGQRMQVKLSNVPDYAAYSWFRVVSRTVSQPLKTDNDYDVELVLSPQETASAVTVVQHVANRATGFGPSLPNPVTIGNVLLYLAVKSKSGNPEPAYNGGAGTSLGGTGNWTQIGSFVSSAGAGDVWTAGAWAKVADGTENGQSNGSGGETECIVYELSSNASIAGAVFTEVGNTTSTNIDLGSLGTPDANLVALMAIGQYTTDMGSMGFTPDTGWIADWEWTTPFFGDARPYWLGHLITDGSAVEAKVTSTVSFPFAGIAVLLPGPA